ncbi:hypothetical protein [Actinokineospora sp.]|uniref:hypothetical protein n=1 Tax=Actinokineospora sp. TaxID=1872133 RepID=UPI00403765D2
MAIDPTHLPIFGDPAPADPPAPVRAASALLLVQVVLSGLHLTYLAVATDRDLALFAVPLALTAWFALSVRAGRDWARPVASAAAGVSPLLTVALLSGPLDVALLALSVALITNAVHLMYRADVREYFLPADADRTERV